MSATSPSAKILRKAKYVLNGPSSHPQSPVIQLTNSSPQNGYTTSYSNTASLITSQDVQPHNVSVADRPSSDRDSLKRKRENEEEIPSSSPIGPAISPKRQRQSYVKPLQEIPSTPEKTVNMVANLRERTSTTPSIKDESGEDNSPDLYLQESFSPLGQQPSETLSEPDHRARNTQAVFQDPTQTIDFDAPPPDEGWDNEDQIRATDSESVYESATTEIHDHQPALRDTQTFLKGKTQSPDFELPDPDGGWNNIIPSSPPAMPSSPQAESVVSQTEINAQCEAWVETHVKEGFSPELVVMVLNSTTMDTSLAGEVLRQMGREGEVPSDRRGVWTQSDDEALASPDARQIQRLQKKHGEDGLKSRWEFLEFIASES